MADLGAAGLSGDEAFLVAVKRMGAIDGLSREFAREHSDRLWKQLVLSAPAEREHPNGLVEALAFAVAAGLAIQIARLAFNFPDEESPAFFRNLSLFVLPFLAGYFARDASSLCVRACSVCAIPCVIAAVVSTYIRFDRGWIDRVVGGTHLPVALWFAVAYPYMRGA